MRESELWTEEVVDPSDAWSRVNRNVNLDRIKRLAGGPIAGDDDLESAMSLTRLVRGAYTSFGTDGSADVGPEESRIILRALKMVLQRRGIVFDPLAMSTPLGPWMTARNGPTFASPAALQRS